MNCGTKLGYGNHKSANTPPCFWCKEWKRKDDAGLVVVAPTRAPKKPRPKKPHKPVECGTTSGFHQHRYYHTEVCQPCRDAWNERSRDLYAERVGRVPASRIDVEAPIVHGTSLGRGQHKRRGEAPCEPCRKQYNKDNADARRRRLAAAGQEFVPKALTHGTLAAYKDHLAKKEPTCDPCRKANSDSKAEYRERTGRK